MNKEAICLIPARGGSKRIPKKNIKKFLGIPIIAYSIKAAKESGLFDEVYVYSDDNEIKEIGNYYGANTSFCRSYESSNDFATLAQVVDEFTSEYEKLKGSNPKFLCCLLATAPLVKSKIIQSALYILKEDPNTDSVRPIVEFTYPTQRALFLDENRNLNFIFPQYKKARTQDIPKTYHDAGQFYFMKWQSGLTGPIKKGIVISSLNSQDIYTEDDWLLAEAKYKLMKKKH